MHKLKKLFGLEQEASVNLSWDTRTLELLQKPDPYMKYIGRGVVAQEDSWGNASTGAFTVPEGTVFWIIAIVKEERHGETRTFYEVDFEGMPLYRSETETPGWALEGRRTMDVQLFSQKESSLHLAWDTRGLEKAFGPDPSQTYIGTLYLKEETQFNNLRTATPRYVIVQPSQRGWILTYGKDTVVGAGNMYLVDFEDSPLFRSDFQIGWRIEPRMVHNVKMNERFSWDTRPIERSMISSFDQFLQNTRTAWDTRVLEDLVQGLHDGDYVEVTATDEDELERLGVPVERVNEGSMGEVEHIDGNVVLVYFPETNDSVYFLKSHLKRIHKEWYPYA